MKGEWLLIRLKPRGKEKAENWLLRKIDDGDAGATDYLVETGLTSVKTGRTMQEIAEGKKGKVRSQGQSQGGRASSPAFHEPQLATLVDTVPTGNDWLHEVKYDGYRALLSDRRGRAENLHSHRARLDGEVPRHRGGSGDRSPAPR
jgi:bifunctional non-homologous end joining protein LigD